MLFYKYITLKIYQYIIKIIKTRIIFILKDSLNSEIIKNYLGVFI